MNQTRNLRWIAISATLALATGLAGAQILVANFSNFSESGNLLDPDHTRDQVFTPSGASVTVINGGVSGAGFVGQETYLSDEFPTLAAGDRISINLGSVTWDAANPAQTIALAVSSTETPTTRSNLLVWGWRNTTMFAGAFDASGGYTGQLPAFPASGIPDSVFIERTATGWTLGSIKEGVETLFYTNVTNIGGRSITADGTSIGLFSDMRDDSSTWTVSNLEVGPPPPPVLRISQSGGALDFEWYSRSGMQYDLVSSTDLSTAVSTWLPYDDGVTIHENIATSGTGTNTLIGVQKVGPHRFFAILPEPAP